MKYQKLPTYIHITLNTLGFSALLQTAALGADPDPFGPDTPPATPLRGYAQETDTRVRIQRPVDNTVNSVYEGRADQNTTSTQTSIVNTQDFKSVEQSPMSQLPFDNQSQAPSKVPIVGNATGGQDEYWVNWDTWRYRIADAVWGPIEAKRIKLWGSTRVEYNVTKDHRIQITSVSSPDPTGKSSKILVDAIMALDGDPILEFPKGSRQMIHPNVNMVVGMPAPTRIKYTIHAQGGTEHVFDQW